MKREIETTGRRGQSTHKSTEHIIDYLQTIAREVKDKKLAEFYQYLPDCYSYDADIVSMALDLRKSATASAAAELVLARL